MGLAVWRQLSLSLIDELGIINHCSCHRNHSFALPSSSDSYLHVLNPDTMKVLAEPNSDVTN